MADALAMIEVDSVATGLLALDALTKRAVVTILEANLVEPGRFLILFAGGVAEVDESFRAGLERCAEGTVDQMLLPFAHPALLAALEGLEDHDGDLDTLGVIEGTHVAGTLEACDRSLKDAQVRLAGLRVAGGLAGRAYYVVHGPQHDVEAALDVGRQILVDRGSLHRVECIPRPHKDMLGWLLRPAPFAPGNTPNWRR
ncbi:MAG: BMC domain-containing protein [Oligoflexia bacterium]|nr:BMC domain-containing protein [Oligoflexia bacterium]